MLVGSSPSAAVFNTPEQARTQFSLWSVMAAPLLIGSSVLNLSSWDLETYTNVEVIAIDQDPLGYADPALLHCKLCRIFEKCASILTAALIFRL